jgi:hypothetical protein
VHKEFIDGKTVNAEFYKGVMNGSPLEAHWTGSSSCVLLSRFFSCRTIMCPTTKLRLPIFDPKKCYNTSSSPVLSRFISARLFSVPQVENEVKRTPTLWMLLRSKKP